MHIVVKGHGEILLNGELISIDRGDIVRVSPSTKHALKAASNTSLFVICTGEVAEGYPENPNARYLIDDGIPDYDDIPSWYANDAKIRDRNAQLKERMLRALQKKEKDSYIAKLNEL